MIFSVSNEGIEWSLDFGPDSATLTQRSHPRKNKKSKKVLPLAASSLLLSHGQDFFNNHLARVASTAHQEGTIETRDDVLSSVGAQDMDTSGYQVSYLDDSKFN